MRTMYLVIGIVGAALLIAPVSVQASLGRQPIWTIGEIAASDARDYSYIQTLRLMRSLEEIRGARERYEHFNNIWQQWPVR